MAGQDRQTAADLSGFLQKNAPYISFFEAVDLIESAVDKGAEPGAHERAGDEKLIFNVSSSMSFPASDITRIEELPAAGRAPRYKMTVAFMGLSGAGGALPSYYIERIAGYEENESVSKDFLDFFHNRLIGLFYRAWHKPRYYRRYRPQGTDIFSSWIFSMFGLGNKELRNSTHIYWPRLLCFAGLLSTRNRSPMIVSAVIARAFNLQAVSIEEWIKRKLPISEDQRTRLGRGRNAFLGKTTILGGEIADIQGKIRIVLSELDFRRFQDFLPHGKDFADLKALAEFMFRDQGAYDLKLGLKKGETHSLTLQQDCPCRLGWSSFLGLGHKNSPHYVVIKGRG